MPDKTIQIRRPDDFHVHFRRGAMLGNVLPHTAEHFGRALVMPNTEPPILTAEDVVRYKEEILSACGGRYRGTFEPLMTIQIVPQTTRAQVKAADRAGAVAGKIYPPPPPRRDHQLRKRGGGLPGTRSRLRGNARVRHGALTARRITRSQRLLP